MAKAKTVYVCRECGARDPKGGGRCMRCGTWGSFEPQVTGGPKPTLNSKGPIPSPRPLSEVPMNEGEIRLRVGIGELDRVLGGGLVTGSLTLIGGDPGVGKSTLLLMVLAAFADRGIPVLYVSGEESARQIRLRAERLRISGECLYLLPETNLDIAMAAAEKMGPAVLVLDSVQTLYTGRLDGVPGSVSQVREVASRAMTLAKTRDIPTFLVGHVTKQGGIAGPKVLEHLVDTVIYFEGDGRSHLRVLRATKNRFGSTGELGFFEMVAEGLKEVPDASARLLKERVVGASGTSVLGALEGSRPLLAEVQALVGRPTPATPGRTVLGLDKARLNMLLAVLGKQGHPLHDRDVFVSAAGGLRLQEPAADLAIAGALVSSLIDKPIRPKTLVFGEVGLVGELRAVPHPGPRLMEAMRHGFDRVVCPKGAEADAPDGLEIVAVSSLREGLDELFGS
ncbi:MAG: DNA repair protein RadA/Sms [Cognaticolwellia sp.]|jgi:DNA repair protein RadA/Sms